MAQGQPPLKGHKKALRRAEQARASVAKAQQRVDALRERLGRAEAKLTRRVARLAAAETAYAALAAPTPDVQDAAPPPPQPAAPETAPRARTNGARPKKEAATALATQSTPRKRSATRTRDTGAPDDAT